MLDDDHLRFPANQRIDRITHVAIQQFRSESALVRFSAGESEGDVEVRAWSGEVRSTPDSHRPFRTVKQRLRLSWTAALTASLILLGWFVSRHTYYAQSSAAAYLALLAVGLPLAVSWPVLRAQRSSATRSGLLATCVRAFCVMGLQGMLALSGPSVQRSQELRAAGRLDEARRELRAAADTGRNAQDARSQHDQVQLELLGSSPNPSLVWANLAQAFFFTDAARQRATSEAVLRTADFAGALQERGDYHQSRLILAGVPSPFRSAPPIRQRLLAAYGHEVETAGVVILSKKRLDERLAACREIGAALAELHKAPEPSHRLASIESACASVQAEDGKRLRVAQQAARAAQLKAEREVKIAEQRERVAARAWATAPLMCRDGTTSPSCVCGGSHRGCCSHHGGVAGCSQ